MANGFGYTFSPSGRNRLREQNGEQGAPQGSRDLGRALQVLSLRLPRVTGGAPIAPDDLLRAQGGPGPIGIPESPMAGPMMPPSEPMAPTTGGGLPPPPVGAIPPSAAPAIPPLITPPQGSQGAPTTPLQTLVNKAGTGTPATGATKGQTAPKKKKTQPSVRGGVPTVTQPSATPRIIPGIGGGPVVDDPLGMASQPFVPEMQETSNNPLQNAARPRWADKYEMDPGMFNTFMS